MDTLCINIHVLISANTLCVCGFCSSALLSLPDTLATALFQAGSTLSSTDKHEIMI